MRFVEETIARVDNAMKEENASDNCKEKCLEENNKE